MNEKIIVVLDTSAFLAKYHLQLDPVKTEIYTVPRVVDEVRDRESREALEVGMGIGRVKVVSPSQKYVSLVREKAWEVGESTSLSQTDLEVAALALELRSKGRVVVITDDYALQNLLLHLNISFKPLRTTGIKLPRKYLIMCRKCGYVSLNPNEKICPICGSPLSKRVVSTSS